MKQRRRSLVLCALAVFALTAAQANAEFRKSSDAVQFDVSSVRLIQNTLQVKIAARVSDGWQFYGTQIAKSGPIPTKFFFADSSARVMRVSSNPQAKMKYDKGFSMNVPYYQGNVHFFVRSKIQKRQAQYPLQVQFMACNANLCLAPETLSLTVVLPK